MEAEDFIVAVKYYYALVTTTLSTFRVNGQNYTVLFEFSNTPSSGLNPYYVKLVEDKQNDFIYGTTYIGSTNGLGCIFKINRTDAGKPQTVLTSFTGTVGSRPYSGVIQANDSYIYGTTPSGGTSNVGAIYKINPTTGIEAALYQFSGTGINTPYGPLVQANNGLLYGTTTQVYGGNGGAIFSIDLNGNLNLLHQFNSNDGSAPYSSMIQASNQYLYGTTSSGGSSGYGTIYRISLNGTFNSLHSFTGGAAGQAPYGPLIEASDQNLYGITSNGVVYRCTLNGIVAPLAVLTTQGSNIYSGLIEIHGNLFGTASAGGSNSAGTIFRVARDGTSVTVIHHFTGSSGGSTPYGTLMVARDSNVYGVTYAGGVAGSGVAFRLSNIPIFNCSQGYTSCQGTCNYYIPDFNNDIFNCGVCNRTCNSTNGFICLNGSCTCDFGTALCNGVCRSGSFFVNNSLNCGVCNNVCPSPNQFCNQTICSCSSSYETCSTFNNSSVCATPIFAYLQDNNNCGRCGNSCNTGAGGLCNAGICTCAAGKNKCGSPDLLAICVNFQNDSNHCGNCTNQCNAGKICQSDNCLCTNGTYNDNNNCGTCGYSCTLGKTCQSGNCSCLSGTFNDNNNCGTCGNQCNAGKICQFGNCLCSNGTFNDNNNCGMCGSQCNAGKTCQFGNCLCASGVFNDNNNCGVCGYSCTLGKTCKSGNCLCNNGTFNDNDNCGLCGNQCNVGGGLSCLSGLCSAGVNYCASAPCAQRVPCLPSTTYPYFKCGCNDTRVYSVCSICGIGSVRTIGLPTNLTVLCDQVSFEPTSIVAAPDFTGYYIADTDKLWLYNVSTYTATVVLGCTTAGLSRNGIGAGPGATAACLTAVDQLTIHTPSNTLFYTEMDYGVKKVNLATYETTTLVSSPPFSAGFRNGIFADNIHHFLYIADGYRIIRYNLQTSSYITFAGKSGISGNVDGATSNATFGNIVSIKGDLARNLLFIASGSYQYVREIDLQTNVVTSYSLDGEAFRIAIDSVFRKAYWEDRNKTTVKVIDYTNINRQAVTIAGTEGTAGYIDANGPGAKFDNFQGSDINPMEGYLVILANNRIRLMGIPTICTNNPCNNGTCSVNISSTSSFSCACFAGYETCPTGVNPAPCATLKSMYDSDTSNCGDCGKVCTSGKICSAGSCICASGIFNDNNNCGFCGTMCTSGQTCFNGSCVCTNGTLNDNNNCGTCGLRCTLGRICSGGSCVCNNGTLNDNNNCGSCLHSCNVAGGLSCQSGICSCSSIALNKCGSFDSTAVCANFETDSNHCSSCNNQCTLGKTCQSGNCQCPSGAFNDNNNCGNCGNLCINGTSCNNGFCECSTGVLGDNNNCGACFSICLNRTTCLSGQCKCLSGVFNDNDNCGECGNECNVAGGLQCSSGECKCVNSSYRLCGNTTLGYCISNITYVNQCGMGYNDTTRCPFINVLGGSSNCSSAIARNYSIGSVCNITCSAGTILSDSLMLFPSPINLKCLSTTYWSINSSFELSYDVSGIRCIPQKILQPKLTDVIPIAIPTGVETTITIIGENLNTIDQLLFNNKSLNIVMISPNSIVAIIKTSFASNSGFITITFTSLVSNNDNGNNNNNNIKTSCSAYPVTGENVDPACLPSNIIPYYTDAAIIPNKFCASALNTSCIDCPENTICPGGDVVIPQIGFYSPNPNTPKVFECDDLTKEKCAGGKPNSPSACFDPYTGTMCSKCSEGYYELNSICLPCNGGNLELSILSVLVFGYFAFLGVSLIYCSDKWLEYVTIFVITTQQILSAGDGLFIRFSPKMRTAFNYLRPFKLDFAFLRTDCSGNNSLVSYTTRFGISVVVLLALFVWFSLFALIYQFRRQKLYIEKTKIFTGKAIVWLPWEWLKNPARPRLIRAFIFLIVITHLQFTSLCLTIINCTEFPIYRYNPDNTGSDTLRMRAEQSTVCYKNGPHLAAAIFSWIFIFTFSIALPIYFLLKLWHGYRNQLLDAKEFRKKYGFMYRRMQPNRFWFRSINWIFSFISALQASVLPKDAYVQIPILLSIATIEAILIIKIQPMLTRKEHIQPLLIVSCKFIGCGLLFLSVKQNIAGGLLTVFGLSCIIYLLYLYRKWSLREKQLELKNQAVNAGMIPGRLSSKYNLNNNLAEDEDEYDNIHQAAKENNTASLPSIKVPEKVNAQIELHSVNNKSNNNDNLNASVFYNKNNHVHSSNNNLNSGRFNIHNANSTSSNTFQSLPVVPKKPQSLSVVDIPNINSHYNSISQNQPSISTLHFHSSSIDYRHHSLDHHNYKNNNNNNNNNNPSHKSPQKFAPSNKSRAAAPSFDILRDVDPFYNITHPIQAQQQQPQVQTKL